MTDGTSDRIEDRLGPALRAGAADAAQGSADDLVRGARTRWRRRRRVHVASTAALVAVAVVGAVVGTAVGLGGPDGSPEPTVADVPRVLPEVSPAPAGWKWISYANVEVAVPGEWGNGSLEAWCASMGADRPSMEPVVDRPGLAVPMIHCGTTTYGLRFGADRFDLDAPPGATVEHAEVGGTPLTVVTADPRLAGEVLATAREIEVNADGCAVRVVMPDLGAMPPSGAALDDRPLVVCHYMGTRHDPVLHDSGVLDDEEAERFVAAVNAAERGTGPTQRRNCGTTTFSDVLIRAGGQDLAWYHTSNSCERGFDLGGATYRLDEDLLRWAQPMVFEGAFPMPRDPWRP